MGLLYFKEGHGSRVLKEHCAEWGLEYAFQRGPMSSPVDGRNTPSGEPGAIFVPSSKNLDDLSYKPDEQVWRKIGKTGCWVGYWKKQKPGPVDLARREIIPGEDVFLGDGNAWTIPHVLDQKEGTRLPRFLDLNDDGDWVYANFSDEHQGVFDEVGKFVDDVSTSTDEMAEGGKISVTGMVELACRAISLNYRVSKYEVVLLKLLNGEDMAAEVVSAASDINSFIEWSNALAKKNNQADEDGLSTSDGSEGLPPKFTPTWGDCLALANDL